LTADAPRKPDQRRFYADALTEAERVEFAAALEVEGVDVEIAFLRQRLLNHLKDRPEDMALLLRGMEVLRRMVATKYGLSRNDQRGFAGVGAETLRRMEGRGEGSRP
jgi:hypothetical protein